MKFKLVEAAESKICCICKKPFDGYGNNAEPICSGICCDECNMKEVIPARMRMLDKTSSEDMDESLNESIDCKSLTALLTDRLPQYTWMINKDGAHIYFIAKDASGASLEFRSTLDFSTEELADKIAGNIDNLQNIEGIDDITIYESLNENSVTSKIPEAIDQFLQDIAQMYQTISYKDIMDHDYTSEDLQKLAKLRGKFRREITYADSGDEDAAAVCETIANDVADIIKRVDEGMNEGRNNPYFTPYGYRDAAKVLNRTAPEYYWHLKEIEMDRGDGIKLANYALKKGLPVMLDKHSDPDYPEFYLKDGSNEYHWGDYFYTYGFTNPDATQLVPYEGNLNVLNTEKDDDKMNEDMSVRAKLKALYPELNFGDEVTEGFDDDMDFDIDESHETRMMDLLYEGSDDFDDHDDEDFDQFSDCEDDECWENDFISNDYDDGM